MELVIGNKNYSSWSLRPWLLLSEYEVPFQELRIALSQSSTKENLLKHTVAGKVPVLNDGDIRVWDSLAICEYVSERYLGGAGWPADVKARAEARACSAEMHSGFSVIRTQMPMNCRATGRVIPLNESVKLEISRIDQIWSQCRTKYSEQGDWLFGEFSIADCMFAPVVSRFNTYGVQLSSTSAQYMRHVLSNENMRKWFADARNESENIENSEVGV